MSNCDIIYSPIKFLGATVLSFNSTLGLGSSESTLKIDLIEDCDDGDDFQPKAGSIGVGAPVYFQAGEFKFGGVLSSWSATQGNSGKTYSVDIVDPRQLLANTVIIIDTYLDKPSQGINYFNVYREIEGDVLEGDCTVFGLSNSNERGMPYNNIIIALKQMIPTIYSPTGYPFTINFNSFPQNIPEYYRVPGPSITLLQLLEDICDVLGFEFYVELLSGAVINIGLINLKIPPSSFGEIVGSFDGKATELSYGQELRNEITKTVLFGENQHYLSRVNKFSHFFGEDFINNKFIPVVPFAVDDCGFWINKKVDSLNLMLKQPLASNGPFAIHELDIRCAMSSMEMWMLRVFDDEFQNMGDTVFNKVVQNLFGNEYKTKTKQAIASAISHVSPSDRSLNPIKARVSHNSPLAFSELEIIYNWVKNLGTTYYGKQFISPLNQKICYYQLDNTPTAERFFSDIPTNDGGWVDDGTPVLGLNDPELGVFRSDDSRIISFAMFNNTGTYDSGGSDTIGEPETDPESSYVGDINPPTNPIV